MLFVYRNHYMSIRRFQRLITLVSLCALAAAAGTAPKYVHPQDVDYQKLLAPPPAEGSDEQKAELKTLRDWQNKRTPDEIARCKAEAPANYFIFSSAVGSWFNEKNLPRTAALLAQATVDLNSVSETAKANYKRPRPYVADPTIHPVLKAEKSASYPSGHAVRGIVWATLLSEMFPEHKDDLMKLGKQYGDDRVIAGMHYPSDVIAGQKLGAVIAKKLLDNSEFKSELEHARDECMALSH
jgi:acid phosphatase (class A)